MVPKSFFPWIAGTGLFTSPVFGRSGGISPDGGRFHISHGQNEQQEGWKGLTAITATDTAESPAIRMRGELSSPSQVCDGGNSRKSRRTTSLSMASWCHGPLHNDFDPRLIRKQHESDRTPEYVEHEPDRGGNEISCYTDGASRGNPGPSAGAYLLVDKKGAIFEERGWFLGTCTNNEAEYRALIAGLSAAAGHEPDVIFVYSDSELVIRQMEGSYRVNSPRLKPLHSLAMELCTRFRIVRFRSVSRENPLIRRADLLCNHALDAASAGEAGT
jgi:ribonuclease HI